MLTTKKNPGEILILPSKVATNLNDSAEVSNKNPWMCVNQFEVELQVRISFVVNEENWDIYILFDRAIQNKFLNVFVRRDKYLNDKKFNLEL